MPKNYNAIAVLIAIICTLGWLMFRDLSDNRRTIDALRSEVGQAATDNRQLKDSNDRLNKINQQLTGELEKSNGLVCAISDNNRRTEANNLEAGKIITELKGLNSEVRKTGKEK